ncbi:cyclin-domain-containing protein [Gloeophyllum trabeum ATCC 11539]|uniref:Cyclin-domain-containing protein n=1 Tax=Gloeophyllum trabeum (strain ATCC 11539 / FP-39264 / Madison 617) TaxID=670483 RepID=S7RW08_GLOTA|nr:cyclin-domain-containing protein [Gloeophyllum trabeum ATCC 11539]EPQ57474.1 cyclin-domain-containing protein [Gloeophyllum trabeum ATCC 11539]
MESSERIELPASFEDVSIDHLVLLIADMLERLIAHNDQIPLVPEGLTRFHSRAAPNISVLDYLRRIVRFTNVEKACLLLTLHYIDQICARMPLFTLSSLTAHRFIVASVAISSKAFCDAFCTNSHYAKVGGISIVELNVLEREFLRIIDWDLTCTRELLQEYYVNLVRTHSSGKFVIPTTQQSSSGSSDSEIEVDSGRSRPMSPVEGNSHAGHPPVPHGASTILIDTATLSPQPSQGPTIEQNMAFAALRESMDQS